MLTLLVAFLRFAGRRFPIYGYTGRGLGKSRGIRLSAADSSHQFSSDPARDTEGNDHLQDSCRGFRKSCMQKQSSSCASLWPVRKR